jgi:membrane-bound lytic murein transglycosylase MltF
MNNLIGGLLIAGIVVKIGVNIWLEAHPTTVVYAAEQPEIVQLEVKVDWTEDRIKREIREVFVEIPELAIAIANCESRLKPDARNPVTPDTGIFQINNVHKKDWEAQGYTDMTDPEQNIAYAHSLYKRDGLSPWKPSQTCWLK